MKKSDNKYYKSIIYIEFLCAEDKVMNKGYTE